MMVTNNPLLDEAEKFKTLLEKYAKSDPDVEDFLRRFMPWFEKINKGKVTVPCYEYQLFIYFTNPDLSPLAERYAGKELGEADAVFASAIRGW